LKTPIVAAASPLKGDLDALRRMEEACAAAVVFSSRPPGGGPRVIERPS
jgi:hypothetical protein